MTVDTGPVTTGPIVTSPEATTTAADTADLVQLLTPEGERIERSDYPISVTTDEIKDLYRDLVLVRRLDTEAIALQRQGELGIWASLLGQEAAQIGSGRAVGPRDMVFPSYREHGVAWCRGVDPVRLLELFRGVSHGGWDPDEHGFHLYTIVVGGHTLHATGYAMGLQRDGLVGDDEAGTGASGEPGAAAIAYFGDGATSQGDVNEAFIWASVTGAPIVFFCQNNQFAISEPIERQSRIPLYQRARGFGFPGIRVDGNDVLACLAVTSAALRAARSGQGPTLVEAFTYRMGAHTTTDDPTRYRLASELETWKLKDPIERVKAHLVRGGHTDAAFFAQVEGEADRLGQRLRAACRALPEPDPLSMFDHVYAGPHSVLDAERERYAGYLDSFADDDEPPGEGAAGSEPHGSHGSPAAASAAVGAAAAAAEREEVR